MTTKSLVLPLLAAVLLVALAFVGLDVVDSDRTVVVVGGYLWFAALAAAGLLIILRTFRSRRVG